MGPASSKQVSELLLHWGNGDRKALEAILPLVYNELRRLARYHLKQKRPNHTLQTTALVHEAYLRLAEEKSLQVKDRGHFLGIAAQLMRWILVDYENNSDWNFKDLEEMMRNAKSLKRNNKEFDGILIGPWLFPRF